MNERPIIIDENDGPCEYCADWQTKFPRCEECGENDGNIEACVPHHFHLRGIGPGGIPGRVGINQRLCKECAIALRLKVYPPGVKNKNGTPNPTAEQMRAYTG